MYGPVSFRTLKEIEVSEIELSEAYSEPCQTSKIKRF